MKTVHFNKFQFLGGEEILKAVSWSRLTLTLTENKVYCIWAVRCQKTQPGWKVAIRIGCCLLNLVLRRPVREYFSKC